MKTTVKLADNKERDEDVKNRNTGVEIKWIGGTEMKREQTFSKVKKQIWKDIEKDHGQRDRHEKKETR